MILLVWIMMVVLPTIIGAGVMTVVYRKNTRMHILFSDCYVLGMLACIGIGEMAHAIGRMGTVTLTKTGMLFGVFVAAIAVVSFVIALHGFRQNKNRYTLWLVGERTSQVLPIAFLLLFLAQILFIYCKNPLVTAGDITLETVQSFLVQDGIYKVLPLTGMVSEQGMPLRYTILCLPTIYAILSQQFGIEAELVVCHIMPIGVLAGSYLAYYRLSNTLFGEKKLSRRFWFLIIVGLVFTFSEGAVFLDGYSALHSGYTGVAIRNLVLVPYALSAALEGRWWKVILCILAEACIVWTFLGCGVCVVIALGILILEILEKRVPKLSKLLRFFREKEELA